MKTTLKFALAGALLAASCALASAQQAPTVRVRGTIEKVDGNDADAEDHATASAKLTLTGNAHDRRRGQGIDGRHQGRHVPRQRRDAAAGRHARRRWRCTSSPRQMRGTGEGHRPYAPVPNSTMTNGTAAGATVAGVDGSTIMVKYKDGEKKIVVPPNVPIVRYEIGSAADLKPGAAFTVAGRDQEAGRHATRPRASMSAATGQCRSRSLASAPGCAPLNSSRSFVSGCPAS